MSTVTVHSDYLRVLLLSGQVLSRLKPSTCPGEPIKSLHPWRQDVVHMGSDVDLARPGLSLIHLQRLLGSRLSSEGVAVCPKTTVASGS